MPTAISSQMDEIEVINVLKRYSDKKRERETERFLFSAAIQTYLANSWSDISYMCKVKYKIFANR